MADSICVGCGMCCDGTLFSHATIKPNDDSSLLVSLGFVVEGDESNRWFTQPCQAFGGGQCHVYEQRPRTCRRFRCALLVEHEDGNLPAADAVRVIRQAADVRDRVRDAAVTLLGDDARTQAISALQTRLNSIVESDVDRSTHAQLLLDLATLDLLLKRRFVPDRPVEPTS